MASGPLTNNEQMTAELYALKMTFSALLALVFKQASDQQSASNMLAEITADSIDGFVLYGTSPDRMEMIREAMHERAMAIISAAANPTQMPPSHRP
jgi:hypothetical protein